MLLRCSSSRVEAWAGAQTALRTQAAYVSDGCRKDGNEDMKGVCVQ